METRAPKPKPMEIAQLFAAILRVFLLAPLAACTPDPGRLFLPAGDIRPPTLLSATQANPSEFLARFDEDIDAVVGSFSFSPPGSEVEPESAGQELKVRFSPPLSPGVACSLSGEVQDRSGNSLRFIFSFIGFNGRPALLRITEVQTGKNSSASNNHRDYLEFSVLEEGNLGGIQVKWCSTVKEMEYVFPPCEVAKGEFLVLHCAPEGIPEEKDELGQDLALSGGVDSNPGARDFWTKAGGLPDETGLVAVSPREGDPFKDGLLYVASDKTGGIDSPRLKTLAAQLGSEGLWVFSPVPSWEDGFQWKPSTSRSLFRKAGNVSGKEAWEVGEPGSQSPGSLASQPPLPSRKKTKRSSTLPK